MFKNILLATSAAALITATAVPMATAEDQGAKAVIGTTAGATTGAITGGIIAGPIGAIIGGFAGATIGAAATVPDDVVLYSTANPVEPIYIDADVQVGGRLGEPVTLYDVPGHPGYGYVYINDRVYIVSRDSREIIYSPAYIVPQQAVTYVEANPTASFSYADGTIEAGIVLPAEIEVTPVPEARRYAYVYIDDRPVIVDSQTRTVVMVR